MPVGPPPGPVTGSQCLARANDYLDHRRHPRPIEHAYVPLRQALGPLQPGRVVVVSADAGAGRSTFALDLCRSTTIDQGLTCLLVSPQLTPEQIGTRLLAAQARVDGIALRTGDIGPSERQCVDAASAQIEAAGLLVVPTPLDASAMLSAVLDAWLEHDVDLVIVDDADLILASAAGGDDVYESLRMMAGRLAIPVVATARLPRDRPGSEAEALTASRDETWPGGSRSAAGPSIVIHRPDLYTGGGSSRPGEADLLVRTSAGDRVTVQMLWLGHQPRFAEMAPQS